MGDQRRHILFADYIVQVVPRHYRIADVATGKGQLSFLLRELGYQVVPFESRPRKGGQVSRLGMRVEDFRPEHAQEFDVVIGMHPDGATDCILEGCAKYGKMGIVCPCCVRPNAWTYWGSKNSQRQWIDHLVGQSISRGLKVKQGRLKMSGAASIIEVSAA